MDDDLKIHGMKDNITFNPERGLQDLELEVIDLAHPFVNRFIEKVKYTMYVKTESSGRIAGVYTNSVDNVTAIVTVLVRYMVETDPPSVMEDIAPVVIDVYNNKMLDDKYIEQIESPKISGNVDKETIKEAIDELYNRCELNDFINKAIDNNMNYLMQKRKRMKSNFNSGINQVRYLDGFENITVASKDILTITLFYPD
jgi:hypothetical protein